MSKLQFLVPTNAFRCKNILQINDVFHEEMSLFWKKSLNLRDIFNNDEKICKLFDINYAKNKLNEYLKNDIEAELCIRIKNNKYMIIPLKDKISFQWIGKTNEIYYKNVEELFSSKLINGIILDKDWNQLKDIYY